MSDLSRLKKRVANVFALGMLGNLLTVVSSFVLPPYFILNWGEQRYGAWLYVFSVPLSLAMFDLGISAAFSTEVYKLYSQGNSIAAAMMFKQGVKFLTGLILIILCVLCLICWVMAMKWSGSLEVLMSAAILCVYVLIGFYSELLTAPYKMHGKFHILQLAGLAGKIFELTALIYLIPSDSFVKMAFALLSLRLALAVTIAIYAHKIAPNLYAGNWYTSVVINHLYTPSLMYAVNPLIVFISMQLPLIIIGSSLSLTTLVAYTTIRTLARLPVQIASQISFSLQIEYTRMHFEDSSSRLHKIYRKSIIIIVAIFLAWMVVGGIGGEMFYEFWIKRIEPDFRMLFLLIVVDALFESVMRNKIALSASINKHKMDVLTHLSIVAIAASATYVSSLLSDSLVLLLIPSILIYGLCAGFLVINMRAVFHGKRLGCMDEVK